PEAVPGSHHGAWAASRPVDLSQSYRSSRVIGWSQPETPEVCDSRWRTLIPALPRAANSGQYRATGASRSSSPRSTSTSAARAVGVSVERGAQVYARLELGGEQLAQGVEADAARAAQRRRVIAHEASVQQSQLKLTPMWRGQL